MSIINKPDFKVFADEAKTSEIVTFPDILRGWGITLEQTAGKPPMEWFNALGKRVDEWLMYLSQRGVTEWDAALDYPQYALTQYNGQLYIATAENKNQRPDNSQTAWKLLADELGIQQKLDKTAIVQTAGLATDKVMSQKAVTDALANAVNIDVIYPVGIVTFFAENKDPNTLFPGTIWTYLGEDRVIRLGKKDASDVKTTGGADTVTLSAANMPVHNHSFSGTTSSFDYGNKTTSSGGNHAHKFTAPSGRTGLPDDGKVSANDCTNGAFTYNKEGWISNDGNHAHTVSIGSHTHTYSGNTGSTGSGTAFSITNPYIKLMGWYRSE